MSSIPVQIITHFLANNIGPIVSSTITNAYTSYHAPVSQQTTARQEIDDERELELLQMDRFISWMKLVFEDTSDSGTQSGAHSETHKAYKQELYSIYVTICSDYKQYQQWKRYNESLWILSSLRRKNTKGLSRKILADVKLFKEGLEMFSMFERL